MKTRLSRSEQAEVVRSDLLAAARAEFLANGYHGATVDGIAAAAGYTKGVVYSRFASKADLFLVLLEERIATRAQQNEELVRTLRGAEGLAEIAERWAEIERADLAWTLVVIEFRVQAARTPELNARYAELHTRTVEGVQRVLASLLGIDAEPDQARWLLAMGVGSTLERAVDAAVLTEERLPQILGAIAGLPEPERRTGGRR
jgi:AcrR family transcriptional regulator